MNLAPSILIFAIRLYRWTISPVLPILFGPTGGCRFTPSCSEYAMDAIRSRGSVAGSWLALKRIARCHPWGGCGPDPAPDKGFKGYRSPAGSDAAWVDTCRADVGNSEIRI